MRTWTETHREGTDMGPIDWSHPKAKDMPEIWREAEKSPEAFALDTGNMTNRKIVALRMYDGWPYWVPMPAILTIGPMDSAEWLHFDSYGVRPNSVVRRLK